MVRAVYTVILVAGLFVMAPVLLFRGIRHRKYLGSLTERLGQPNVRQSDLPTLWIHAVSVGEVIAAEPFVRAAVERLSAWRIVVSTTTATGQQVARDRFPGLDVFYFPLDLPGPVARSMARVRPSAVCLVETEIWPNVLAACRKRGVPVAVINGRLSDNSFRGYSRARRLLRGVLAGVSRFLMQSPADAERMRSLGADATRVTVAGNMKYDVDLDDQERRAAPRRAELQRVFGLPDERPLIVAGSTSAGEEAMLLEALMTLRRRPGLGETRLMIAPRHPERFDEVARSVISSGFVLVRRSSAAPDPANGAADVLLLDSIGELAAAYADATLVFVGGSLVPKGGHSILEPALYGRPILVGPYTANFRQVVRDFLDAGAVVQLSVEEAHAEGLAKVLGDLLLDGERRAQIGTRAIAVLESNRGATAKTLEAVCEMLEQSVSRT